MEVAGLTEADVGLGGFALMFKTLPLVFNSLGVVGAIIGAFFFLMVAIAAITSVVSLVEVVTQFVIQKFKISRKVAAIAPMMITMLISVFVSLSLGGHFSVFHFDLLTFFDEITNTVLMPVCAFAVCVAAGFGIKKQELEENVFPGKPIVGAVISYMARFLTPALILVVAVFGVVTNVSENAWYYSVIAGAVLLSVIAAAIYFAFRLDRKNTGCNADELASIANAD
jgi:NSS family neurotransmitter:Na+ symporter